jgi:hypothetical protein
LLLQKNTQSEDLPIQNCTARRIEGARRRRASRIRLQHGGRISTHLDESTFD